MREGEDHGQAGARQVLGPVPAEVRRLPPPAAMPMPDDECQSQPVSGLRSAAELAVHVSGTVVRDIARGIATGRITAEEGAEPRLAKELDKRDLIAFARQCFDEADIAVARIGDAELRAIVSTPWEKSWPGWVGFLDHERRVHAPPRAACTSTLASSVSRRRPCGASGRTRRSSARRRLVRLCLQRAPVVSCPV